MHGYLSKTTLAHVSQQTLKRSIVATGVGVHTGCGCRVVIKPAPANFGICFIRHDIRIPAHLDYITNTQGATTLSRNGVSVQMVEHVLAALFGLGYDNAFIHVDGPEIPILDGSALPWVKILRYAGIQTLDAPRQVLTLNKRFQFQRGHSKAIIEPAHIASWSSHIQLGQQHQFAFTKDNLSNFQNLIAAARTYVDEKAIASMKSRGLLQGANESCGILLKNMQPINTSWRFRNECARHKILDAQGDFSLLGARLVAKIQLWNNTHGFHQQLLQQLLSDPPNGDR